MVHEVEQRYMINPLACERPSLGLGRYSDSEVVLFAPSCAPLLRSDFSPMTDDPLTPQTTWSQYTTEVYLMGKHPIIGSYDYRVVEERAREATKDNHGAFAPLHTSRHIN